MARESEPGGTVLLLHGWGGSYERIWKNTGFVDRLKAIGLTPLEIDLPGHGKSIRSHRPEDYTDLAGDVLARLNESEPIYGIGYSLGAKIVLEIERRAPGTFSRIVLAGLGANVFAPEKLGDALANALEHGVDESTPAAIKKLVEYGVASGNDPLAIAACLRRPANPILSVSGVADVRCPTLLVCGRQDLIALPLDPLSNALPSNEVTLLDGVGHLDLPESEQFQVTAAEFLLRDGASSTSTSDSL